MMLNEHTQEMMRELHWMGGLIQTLDVGLVVIDRGYKIQMWNTFMENHSGIDSSEIMDCNLFESFPQISEDWFKAKIDTVFLLKNRAFTTWEQREKVFEFSNYRPVTSTADFMYQNVTLIPLGGDQEDVDQVGIIVYDVTDAAITKNALEGSNQDLEILSRKDMLTGLFNRGYWEECLQHEFKRYSRTGSAPSLLMFDIDHFKQVNDNYGHPAGDEVIRCIASIASEGIRETDMAGRYGGEEFAIILVDTGHEGAHITAERLRASIEAKTVIHGSDELKVTVSIGVAELNDSVEDYEQWIEQADRALYHSKENGRNQVAIFSELPMH